MGGICFQAYGRHVASNRKVSGAYKTELGADDEINTIMKKVKVCWFIVKPGLKVIFE